MRLLGNRLGGCCGKARQKRRALLWGGVLLGWLALVPGAQGQDLIERYRQARLRAEANRVLAQHGPRLLPLPPTRAPTRGDTLRAWIAQYQPLPPAPPPEPEPPAGLVITSTRLIRKLEYKWFEWRFRETLWSFLGSGTFSPLDTLHSRELRARLEAHFGPPTRTLAELGDPDNLRREEIVQFEYWFVLNDSIPLVLMDVNGPLDRGLVLASDQQYRDLLYNLRETFLKPLVETDLRKPYVDYYFQYETHQWYRAGFDGRQHFLTRIPRPNLALGRPVLRENEN